ncbi:hypothetical protein CI109_103927 [Kwoniella shandongensis]|uniref:Uncharacterized protein n=1 Tax=Kwoniella shandongensis TaxID=1734106 RepID=A0A5M6BTE9_9TREE|nr:uncharacterized protein CI109_005619 [Kwoniella shandongensis]KAA5526023.1 hypothetical protein CI109_005619 [Kwoniella shandongensis]
MEGNIDNAKKFLNSEEGKAMNQQIFGNNNQASGDPQKDSDSAPSYDAQGNQGASGQFGQEGQFGAVRGGGFGSGVPGLAKGPDGQPQGGQQKTGGGDYEGYDQGDSTGEGGWGKNAQGGAFSRQNQLGTDHKNHANPGGVDNSPDMEGYKTGYSTPGYRREDEDEEERAKKLNQNVYGDQADDRGSKGNDYNEAI